MQTWYKYETQWNTTAAFKLDPLAPSVKMPDRGHESVLQICKLHPADKWQLPRRWAPSIGYMGPWYIMILINSRLPMQNDPLYPTSSYRPLHHYSNTQLDWEFVTFPEKTDRFHHAEAQKLENLQAPAALQRSHSSRERVERLRAARANKWSQNVVISGVIENDNAKNPHKWACKWYIICKWGGNATAMFWLPEGTSYLDGRFSLLTGW